MEDHLGYSYFKVMHPGGCVVRTEPTLFAQSTGLVVSKDSIIPTRNIVSGEGNIFVELIEGGWVVVQKGPLQACIKINGPSMKTGEWLYEVVHPSGARFARSSDISEASERHEKSHPKGTVLKAISKRTEIESVVTVVQLDGDNGWLFEHANTGEVLDRLGNELVVIPSNEGRELRELYAKIVNPDGVHILTTPTETSVWKGRLEFDKVVLCSEVFKVPIFTSADDNPGVIPIQIGLIVYYRLKDQKGGWIVAGRGTSEPNRPSTQIMEAMEIDPAVSAGGGNNSVIPIPRSPQIQSKSKTGGNGITDLLNASGEGDSSSGIFEFAGNRIRSNSNASASKATATSPLPTTTPIGVSNDRIMEDEPCDAWFRVVYKGGLKLRGGPSMHDLLDGTLPVGCFVKTSRRVVVRSNTQPNPVGGITGVNTSIVFLQLVACVGAKVRVADAWVFESITDLDAMQDSVIIAAEKVSEPLVESQSGLVLMVLYPGGITLRASPHMSAAKTQQVVKMYECTSVQGIISTSDNMESFALLPGGAWLPCKAPGGLEVAVRVPRAPSSRSGLFEVTMKAECPTLYGPFPDTPSLPQTLPKGSVMQFDMMLWYSADDGSVNAADIFFRLEPTDALIPTPAVWIRRDDEVLNIVENYPLQQN